MGKYKNKWQFILYMDLGQHFMIDKPLIKRIVDAAEIQTDTVILEIGSGKGALTKYLLNEKPKKLICVEKDESLVVEGVEVIHVDILDIIKDISFDIIVANLPYQISEPLFQQISILRPKKLVLVVGKKFAEQLLGETIVGLVIRAIYTVEKLEEIPPDSFNPKPKVDSALVRLKLKETISNGLEGFFEHSQQKVKNYILMITEGKFTKRGIREKMLVLSEDLLDKRLYTLSTKEFLILANFISDNL